MTNTLTTICGIWRCNRADKHALEVLLIKVIVDSPNVRCDGNEIETRFQFRKNHFSHTANGLKVTPKEHEYVFRTQLKPKKTGMSSALRRSDRIVDARGVAYSFSS